MQMHCVAPANLTAEERAAWAGLHAVDPLYGSPFYHPGYTEIMSRHRPGVEVGVWKERGASVGFFPFERAPRGRGRPIGGRFTDYHGPILAAGHAWDARELVRACGLVDWRFTHLASGTPGFEPFGWVPSSSPILDLSGGYAAYAEGRQQAGSHLLRQVSRKARKLEREHGPLRFVWAENSPALMNQLCAWKAEQRRRTRTPNILDEAWARATVEDLRHTDTPDLGGVLSALYVGDAVAAVHFGLRAATTLHWWFPAYDGRWAPYSPGLILLVELARACADRGIVRLDLGKGQEAYKDGFASGAVPLVEGSVDLRPLAAGCLRGALALRERLRGSLLHKPLKAAKASLRSWRYR